MGIIDTFLDRVLANPEFGPEDVVLTPDHLAWVNDSPDNEPETFPGPGWDEPGYEPTLEEEAEERGYQAGLEGEGPMGSPRGWPDSARMRYTMGRQRGSRERDERLERERIEYEAWLEEMAAEDATAERYTYFHPCEAIEAIGCIEARKV